MCQEPRRNSPSVTPWSPISSSIRTTSLIASSSAWRSSAAESRPALAASRASSSDFGRSRLPTWSARKGGFVRRAMACSSVIYVRSRAVSGARGGRNPVSPPHSEETLSPQGEGESSALRPRLALLAPRLVHLKVGERDAQQRHVEAALLGAADKVADDVVALGGAARHEIALHGSAEGGAAGGQHLARALDGFDTRRMPVGGGDAAALVERLQNQPFAERSRQNLADIGAGERGRRRKRGKHDELVPHRLHDVVVERRVDLGAREGLGDRLAARRALAADFAEGEPLHGADMAYL